MKNSIDNKTKSIESELKKFTKFEKLIRGFRMFGINNVIEGPKKPILRDEVLKTEKLIINIKKELNESLKLLKQLKNNE